MGVKQQFRAAWVKAKEAGAAAFDFRGKPHDTATGEQRANKPADSADLSAVQAVKKVRSLKSKIDDAEAAALGKQ